MEKFGQGTPDDWIERKVYSAHSVLGIALMMVIDVALFGFIGLTIWAVQMMWIPFSPQASSTALATTGATALPGGGCEPQYRAVGHSDRR